MEMTEFIIDYATDEDGGIFQCPPPKKRRSGVGRADKGGNFNEALETILR